MNNVGENIVCILSARNSLTFENVAVNYQVVGVTITGIYFNGHSIFL